MPQLTLQGFTRISIGCMALCAALTHAQGTLEFRVLRNNVEGWRYGEYTGLTTADTRAVVDMHSGKPAGWNDPAGTFWSLDLRNLGLETAAAQLVFGRRGTYGVKLSANGLPHYRFDDPVQTPFLGAGTSRQNLAGDWTAAATTAGQRQLNAQLRDISVDTDRRHLRAQLNLRIDAERDLSTEFQRQYKKGTDVLGTLFGSSGGNARGALLVAPIDYVTDNFAVTLATNTSAGSWSLDYRLSHFANANAQIQWQNPFNNSAWAAGANYSNGALGTMALAPDNTAHSIGLGGVTTLQNGARVSATLNWGRMLQDEVLLPYSSVFNAAVPLPATRLDGRVNTARGALNYTQGLGSRLTLRLHYGFDNRDNDTRSALWRRVAGDSTTQVDALSANARVNLPYSHFKQLARVELQWRLASRQQVQLQYQLRRDERDFTEAGRQLEHEVVLAYLFPASVAGTGRIELQRTQRRADSFAPGTAFIAGHNPDFIATLAGNQLFENDPLLRRYHLADRDRDRAAFSFTRPLATKAALSLNGKVFRDEFPSSLIGRQSSRGWDLTLALNHTLSSSLGWYAWYTRQGYANQQAGYARTNTTPFYPPASRLPGNAWWVATQDLSVSAGIGGNWRAPGSRLSGSVDLVHSDASTLTSPASNGQAFLPLPEVVTRYWTVNLHADYALNDKSSVGLRYRYDSYRSTDYALDGVAVDTLGNVILLGAASPAHSGALVQLTYRHTLP